MIRSPAPVEERGNGGAARGSGYYVVQPGETLYSIAWRHGTDYRTLARLNRIDAPYRIYPGQRLRLTPPPARPATSVASNNATGQQNPSMGKPSKPAANPPSKPATKPASKPGTNSVPAPAPTPKPTTNPTAPTAPTRAPTESGAPTWGWPTRGEVVRRFAADAQGKQGVEIGGKAGQLVVAAAKGVVVYAGSGLRGYGNLIILKHNSRYLTAYGYNQDLLVREGETVKAGQAIATMGMAPSRRPALHFELRRDGKPVDPLSYLPAR